jgi:hypothetical protein
VVNNNDIDQEDDIPLSKLIEMRKIQLEIKSKNASNRDKLAKFIQINRTANLKDFFQAPILHGLNDFLRSDSFNITESILNDIDELSFVEEEDVQEETRQSDNLNIIDLKRGQISSNAMSSPIVKFTSQYDSFISIKILKFS